MKIPQRAGILVCIAVLTQCGTLVSTLLEPMLEPALNEDILAMQGNLADYKEVKAEWPKEVMSLRQFSDSIGKPLSTGFEKIEIVRGEDSVYVNYFLRYSALDSSKFEYIKGDFVMAFSSDSTIAIRHKSFEGKAKDGATVSSSKMEPKRLQQTRSR